MAALHLTAGVLLSLALQALAHGGSLRSRLNWCSALRQH
jgi:hypothetical protein